MIKAIDVCYKTKTILYFIQNLIVNKNYDSYQNLKPNEKNQLAVFLINAAGKVYESECIVESRYFNRTMTLLKTALISDLPEDNQNLVLVLKGNAVDYFEQTMRDLFDYVLENLDINKVA